MMFVIAFSIAAEWLYLLFSCLAAAGVGCLFYYYYNLRRKGAAIIVDDEGVTINFKGHKIYWSEIENIVHHKPSFGDNQRIHSTMIYPKISAYKAIRIRFKKPYAMPGYDVEWMIIENPQKFNDSVFTRWEAYKQGETLH
jgi:hypothetical protein